MKNSKYTRIIYKQIYHKTPMLLLTRRREGWEKMSVSNINLRDLFFLTENWRCNYKSTVWFQDYMRKPSNGNHRKIVGKKNIRIRHREKWRRNSS